MTGAIFFDFYSVWRPDLISEYLESAKALEPEVTEQLAVLVQRYYQGNVTITQLADNFRVRLGNPSIDAKQLRLHETDISPVVVDFMRSLHGHFVKLGVLANLGRMELDLLNNFNSQQQLFEVIASPLSLGIKQPLLSEAVFAAALQAIGEPTRSCIVVSGNDDYLQFASSLGIQAIKFDGLASLAQTLAQQLAKDMPTT
jgi:hypothetical protein